MSEELKLETLAPIVGKVFVVMGTTGEYSDRSEWVVAAYTDEDLAKQHVLEASSAFQAKLAASTPNQHGYFPSGLATSKWDPDARNDYTGCNWYYLVVPLCGPTS